MKFRAKFSTGVMCEIEVPEEKPTDASKFAPKFTWSCELNREVFRPIRDEYMSWAISVHQTLSDFWKIKLIYIFGPKAFLITPDKPPALLSD